MHPQLIELLENIRKIRNFDPDYWIDKKLDLFNEYLQKNKLSACVVSVSGGVDSACVLALACAALKKVNSPLKKILAIAQPIHSTNSIQNRAYDLCYRLNVDILTIDQSDIFDTLSSRVEKELDIESNIYSKGQLKSYMRTPVNYFIAQVLSQSTPAIVLGTGNMDEDGYLFYFCKAGDGVVDVQLIADLHKNEVFKVAEKLNIPKSILDAPPSADLWEGQTDEEELGVSYDFVELYTELLKLDQIIKINMLDKLDKEALEEYNFFTQKIEIIHNKNKHKEKFPINLNVFK